MQSARLKQVNNDYWFRKLIGRKPVFDGYTPGRCHFSTSKLSLSAKAQGTLNKIASDNPHAEFSIFLFLYSFLVKRYYGDEVKFVISVSGLEDLDNGGLDSSRTFFAPDFSLGFPIKELIIKVKDEIEECLMYQVPDCDEISPLLQNHSIALDALTQFSLAFGNPGLQTPLAENIHFQLISDNDYVFKLKHNLNVVDTCIADNFLRHFNFLLEELPVFLQISGNKLDILTPAEKKIILVEFNANDTCASTGSDTIHDLFQQQATKTPGNVALVCEGRKLTYKQLDERSNQVARRIRELYRQTTKRDLVSDTLIGLCLERSLEMVVGILGVLKAGAAYVPIDLSYPQARIDYLLQDTKADVILTQKHLVTEARSRITERKMLCIDLSEDFYQRMDSSSLPQFTKSTNLCYVIYTSGTTGKPKGVMLTHSGIVNRIRWMQSQYSLSPDDVVLQKTPYVFDVSVWELLWANWYGASIVLAKPGGHTDSEYLHQIIESNGVTTLHFVPAMLEAYNNYLLAQNCQLNSSIRQIFCSGEALSGHIVDQTYQNSHPNFKLHNLYGPTEASIDVTFFETIPKKKVYIGKPIHNTQLYVLDPDRLPVPIGIIGELYIGGVGLSAGYLNNKKLTDERFINNPFATKTINSNNYDRLYRTGDLVRWVQDGNIQFIGRNDDQVKYRGYRIETGEIEVAIRKIEGVKQCCVIIKERLSESGNIKYLVGYYVHKPDVREVTPSEILEKLTNVLPDYMIPSALIALHSFPLTVNGKVDKRALPDPDFSTIADQYVEPVTELEGRLCEMYGDVLGLPSDQISTNQNFFRIGGNSFLVILLKNKINQLNEFKHISVADMFKYNSIAKLVDKALNKKSTYKIQDPISLTRNHEVAVIGVSCAFSRADNISELWDLISNQKEGVTLPDHDAIKRFADDAGLDPSKLRPVAGRVAGIDLFDPNFWDISPNEARLLNPQIRKFIEHCWRVLEVSGYANKRKDNNIGVFAGCNDSDYFFEHVINGESAESINAWEALISNSKDAIATKAAYFLGLSGPANSINTACSTGLVTVIEACKNLLLGTCDMALAGGVAFSLSDQEGFVFQTPGVSSKDGHTRTFDKEASGTVFSPGVGVVLLKRLDDAIRDQDNIVCIIKGYASNNDGDRKVGYTAPSVVGQSECIINAIKMANITPDLIEYVECHGTATNLGDPIEVQALREAFLFFQNGNERVDRPPTILGSIKANIGHTGSAAGTAGLIKICAMLQYNIMPGQVNFRVANPELKLHQSNFNVIKKNSEWLPKPGGQRIAAVSSFGIGGTNAHVIVADYLPQVPETRSAQGNDPSSLHFVIPISAKSRESLEGYKTALLGYLLKAEKNGTSPNITDIAYTLQERREHFAYRCAYSVQMIHQLVATLKNDSVFSHANIVGKNRVVFMFPGHGAQYVNMARLLYNNEEVFRSFFDQCTAEANKYLDTDIGQVIYPGQSNRDFEIDNIQWSLISLFIIEYSLARFLEHLGMEASAYIGHSLGEYVAATLSGVFSLADAIYIVVMRSKLLLHVEAGGMLAVNAAPETTWNHIEKSNCEISVINSAEDIVVSGREDDITKLKEVLDGLAIASVRINSKVAGHCRLMEPVVEKFKDLFRNIKLNKPTKRFVANVTGELATDEVATPEYWCAQLRNTVFFSKGIEHLSKLYRHQVTFIEVGTGKNLGYFVNKYKHESGADTIQTSQLLPSARESMARSENGTFEITCKEDILSRLWMSGLIEKPNNVSVLGRSKMLPDLPTYQFNYKKTWLQKGRPSHGKKFNPIEDIFYERSWERVKLTEVTHPFDTIAGKNILVLINDPEAHAAIPPLLDSFHKYCHNVHNVSHRGSNTICLNSRFDLTDESHISQIFVEKTKSGPIDAVIYISPGIDQRDPTVDIIAVRNIFDWLKNSRIRILKFISISFDNFEVLGNEQLQVSPSIIYGATKSIPFEYFTSGTNAVHIDLSSDDNVNCERLFPFINNVCEKDIMVIRGKYGWHPVYKKLKIPNSSSKTYPASGQAVFLATGGLGGLGFAWVSRLAENPQECTIIIIGRSNEANLREDYKARLLSLKNTRHKVYYCSVDMGAVNASSKIKHLLIEKDISKIDVVLHSSGIAAKSAIYEKNKMDIEQVVAPKVRGVESLIHVAKSVPIEYLVCCSSLSSIMPKLGNMEYTAANLYLDEITYRSNPNIKFMLSININQISDTGAAVEFMEKNANSGRSLNSITSSEFAIALQKLLNSKSIKNVCLSRYDIDVLHFNSKNIDNGNTEAARASRVKLIEEDQPKIEQEIAQMIGGVLGIEVMSVHDNFFRIGGNSLFAIKVVSSIDKTFSVEISVKEVFLNPTIRQLADLIRGSKNAPSVDALRHPLDNASQTAEIVHDVLPIQSWRYFEYKEYHEYKWGLFRNVVVLDAANRILRLLLTSKPQLPFRDESYRELFAVKEGDVLERVGAYSPMNAIIYKEFTVIDKEALSVALDTMVRRHENLRTVFFDRGGKVLQKICREDKFPTNLILSDVSDSANSDKALHAMVEDMVAHPFDFQHEQSFKCQLIKCDEERYVFILVIDHIIFDKQSIKIIENELQVLYDAFSKQLPNPLTPLKVQFRDYVGYHFQQCIGEKLESSRSYYRRLFKTLPKKLEIRPVGHRVAKEATSTFDAYGNRKATWHSKGAGYVFVVSREVVDGIYTLASRFEITIFNFLLAAYCKFLRNVSTQDEFVIDSPMSTRNTEDFAKIVGWLNGVLISRVKVDDEMSFGELLISCHKIILDGMDHIYYQDINDALNSTTDKYMSLKWDHLMNAQLNIVEEDMERTMKHSGSKHYVAGHVSSDINFNVSVFKDGLAVNCTYKSCAIHPAEIEMLCEVFVTVLKKAIAMPSAKMKNW